MVRGVWWWWRRIYTVFGIIILGTAVRLTTEAVLDGIEVEYRRRLQGYRKRCSEQRRRHAARGGGGSHSFCAARGGVL